MSFLQVHKLYVRECKSTDWVNTSAVIRAILRWNWNKWSYIWLGGVAQKQFDRNN